MFTLRVQKVVLLFGATTLALLLPVRSALRAADDEIGGCEIPERAFGLLNAHVQKHYRRADGHLTPRFPTREVVAGATFAELVDIYATMARGHAKVYGYALGQQLRYIPPPVQGRLSAEKICWDMMERGLRQDLVSLHYETCNSIRDRHYPEYEKKGLTHGGKEAVEGYCSQNFLRELQTMAGNAMAGAYDAQMTMETGVAPGSAPSLFGRSYDPDALAPVAATTSIGAEDMKATPLGKEIAAMNEVLRDLKTNGERLERGSYEWQVLKRRFDAVQADRDRKGAPLRGIRNTEIRLYGARAQAEAAAIRAATVRYLIERQKLRGVPLHAWFDRQGNLQITQAAPRRRDLADSSGAAARQ